MHSLRSIPAPQRASLAALLSLALLLPACGGGGGGGSAPVAPGLTFRVASTPNLDGSATDQSATVVTNLIRTGDYESSFQINEGYRGLVHFDHARIPNGVVIQSVVVRVHLNRAVGSPITKLGPLMVSHVDIGNSIDVGDHAAGTLQAQFGTLTDNQTGGWKQIDVTSQFGADVVAGRSYSQFRFEHRDRDRNGDRLDDALEFEDGENTGRTGNLPELIVTYTIP